MKERIHTEGQYNKFRQVLLDADTARAGKIKDFKLAQKEAKERLKDWQRECKRMDRKNTL